MGFESKDNKPKSAGKRAVASFVQQDPTKIIKNMQKWQLRSCAGITWIITINKTSKPGLRTDYRTPSTTAPPKEKRCASESLRKKPHKVHIFSENGAQQRGHSLHDSHSILEPP